MCIGDAKLLSKLKERWTVSSSLAWRHGRRTSSFAGSGINGSRSSFAVSHDETDVTNSGSSEWDTGYSQKI